MCQWATNEGTIPWRELAGALAVQWSGVGGEERQTSLLIGVTFHMTSIYIRGLPTVDHTRTYGRTCTVVKDGRWSSLWRVHTGTGSWTMQSRIAL